LVVILVFLPSGRRRKGLWVGPSQSRNREIALVFAQSHDCVSVFGLAVLFSSKTLRGSTTVNSILIGTEKKSREKSEKFQENCIV